MLTKEKKDEIRAFLKESPHISLQNVALLYDVTYAQVYVLNREVHGVKPRVKKKPVKKPAVKAKAKMSRKTILEKAATRYDEAWDSAVAKSPDQLAQLLPPAPVMVYGPDMVNKPPHYTYGGIETIDFIEAKDLNYNLGNVVKYVTRSGLKGTRIEDLKKAVWYLEREINALLGA
jgi:hypothetical protein